MSHCFFLAQGHLDKVVKKIIDYYTQVVMEKLVVDDKRNGTYYVEKSAAYSVIRKQ